MSKVMIEVYSKKGCGKCEAAKDKLCKMGFTYDERELSYYIEPHEGWREDGSVEAMAAHTLMDTLPLIRIGDDFHDYPSAMRTLKTLSRERKDMAVAV